jgi:catechol 2,3-dioxygenase-like lactoylglutathione lyase family enzyme
MFAKTHRSCAGIVVVTLALHFCAAAERPPREPLVGIAHVALRVRDVEKSREFYKLLGFEEAFEFTDPGKPPVSYVKINDHQFIELYGRGDDSQAIGIMHVCYEASDIEAVRKEYDSLGIIAPQTRKARAGNLLFSIHDPDEQIIEYTQYLPGSLHYTDRGKHLGEGRVSKRLQRVVVTVKDVAIATNFYTEKLGFQNLGAGHGLRLSLPGKSGEELGLESAAPTAKPTLAFAVPDVERTAKELKRRGLIVATGHVPETVTDPDGTQVEFVSTDRTIPERSARVETEPRNRRPELTRNY